MKVWPFFGGLYFVNYPGSDLPFHSGAKVLN